jgi:cytochrome bd-type quinol oxidase subunit 2
VTAGGGDLALVERATCRRTVARAVAAMLSGGIAVLYLVLTATVRQAEQAAAASRSTWGAYLLLAAVYLVGAVLLALLDRRALWRGGALVQVGVLVLFVLVGVGVLGPGVVGSAALTDVPVEVWAGVLCATQVLLLGLLAGLALLPTAAEAREARRASDTASAPDGSTAP